MEINILLTRKYFEKDINYIKSRISDRCKLIIPDDYNIESLLDLSKNSHIFLGNLINEQLITNSPNLKFIQIPWTGVDNLDYEVLKKTEVVVCNSHSNSYAVAEHAIALYFAASKKIVYHDKLLRSNKWNRPQKDNSNIISPFSQRISKGKITIIGFGAIGKKIKNFLSGLELDFNIVDVETPNKIEDNCIYFKPEEMFEAIKETEAVFICVPLTNATNGMVNSKFFDYMNSNAIFINISRGEVVNEKDLFLALEGKKIAAAGIDTWSNYPNADNPEVQPSSLYDFSILNNIIMSPHRAAFIGGELPHLDDAITNINRAAENKDPLNIISISKTY